MVGARFIYARKQQQNTQNHMRDTSILSGTESLFSLYTAQILPAFYRYVQENLKSWKLESLKCQCKTRWFWILYKIGWAIAGMHIAQCNAV